MEARLTHLEFIQGVINRLATDSVRMKGCAVVLVSALLVLIATEGYIEFAYIGFVAVLVFWDHDGYFLWQVRLFRDLYHHIRVLNEADIDFLMDLSSFKRTWIHAIPSRALSAFYIALGLSVGAVMIIG